MAQLTACYVDFLSRPSYRAWRWLRMLDLVDEVQLRPYSLDAGTLGPWEADRSTWGLDLLALGEFARDQGPDVHREFCEEAFAAVHAGPWPSLSSDGWLDVGGITGLDMAAFRAEADRWRAEVGLWHAEAVDELGVTGVPSLVFDDERALFVRLEHDVADAEAARRLLLDLADLAGQPIVEIRRTA